MNTRADSRRFPRHPVRADIEVGDGVVGGELFFNAQNLSQGGIFLASDLLLEAGETYWISFILPGTSVAIRARGKVVWVNKEARPGMGLEFLSLSDIEKEALRTYLEST